MNENESIATSRPRKAWSETRNGRITIGVGVIALFVLVFWLATKSRQVLAKPAALMIDEKYLSFGEVWEDPAFIWTLPIRNTTNLEIEIDGFAKSCSCANIEPSKLRIPPEGTAEARLTLDLLSAQGELKPTREMRIQIQPQLKVREGQSQALKSPPVWEISGRVRRVLECDRQQYLGRCSELSQPLTSRTISLKSLVPLRCISAECDLPEWVASVGQVKGAEWELRLAAPSALRVGAFQGAGSLKPVLKGGELLPPQRISFSGEIVPDVEAVPAAVQVGGRRLGETFEDTVLLRSLTGHAFTTTGSEAKGSGLTVQPIIGGQRFLVRQAACKEGTQSNRVLLHVQSGGREMTITVPVIYTGVESR